MADQPPRTTIYQISSPVTSPVFTNIMSPAITSPSSSNYILTSSSVRPRSNYTIVGGSSQAPSAKNDAHQYVIQPTTRTTAPQYVSTSSIRHIIPSSGAQSSNVTYMLPSGAHIVRMSNVVTTTVAGDQRSNSQIILTSSTHKTSARSSNSAVPELSMASGSGNSRTPGAPTPGFQKPAVNVSKLATAAYYSKFIGTESPPTISIRTNPNEQKPSSIIITPNDWANSKNVSISNIQKTPSFVQIPVIQRAGARPNVDTQQPQRAQVRSVIFPTNFRSTTVSSQPSADCKVMLNVPAQVLNPNDKPSNIPNIPVSTIQQINPSFIQIPLGQKPGANVHNQQVGQLPQAPVHSVIIPANYRSATTNIVTPRQPIRGSRIILKPVLKNVPPARFSVRQTVPLRNAVPRQIPPNVRPTIPLNRPPTSRIQNEIIADSNIKPIPLKGRDKHLVISKKSIQICIDEYNLKFKSTEKSNLNLTPEAMDLVQAEECKKYLIGCRTTVLSEDTVRTACAEYFSTFYGNKLWPLFCLKPNDDNSNPDNDIWMRKHNNVNLVGWMKHPKFSLPSYCRKRRNHLAIKPVSMDSLMEVSETVFEGALPKSTSGSSEEAGPKKIFLQSTLPDQVPFTSVL